MDKGQLSEGDAIMNAGLLANNIARLTERPLSSKGFFNEALRKLKGADMKNMYDQVGEGFGKNAYLTAVTLGLGLPLYMYYRKGINKDKKEAPRDNNI